LAHHWNPPRPSETTEGALFFISVLTVIIRFAKPKATFGRHWNQRHPSDASAVMLVFLFILHPIRQAEGLFILFRISSIFFIFSLKISPYNN
jgi:hypothetical protein